MPAVSQKQRAFFGYMQSHPDEAAARGISPSLAKEYLTPGKLPERVKDGKPVGKAKRPHVFGRLSS